MRIKERKQNSLFFKEFFQVDCVIDSQMFSIALLELSSVCSLPSISIKAMRIKWLSIFAF